VESIGDGGGALVGVEDRPTGRTSLDDLYRDEFERMVRLAYLLTGSSAVAEDLVQDSFVRVQQKWGSIRQPSAYLRTSVVNACRAHHRTTKRHQARFPELVTEMVTPETPMLLDALARLPYRQRAALVLKFYEDRSEADIAETLKCRPATVRSLVHRGLATLRRVITP
jgi:RNA polymerase sigma-70 factor (sigma-E family)